jgi:uncharacterized protein YceH (UPF0502 family)
MAAVAQVGYLAARPRVHRGRRRATGHCVRSQARRPSERYWLLYLRVFPEWATGEPRPAEADTTGTAASSSVHTADSADPQDIRALAATVRALEQRIAGLTRRLDELSHDEHREHREHRERRPREATA